MKTAGDNSELQKRMNARLWQCVMDPGQGGVQDFAKMTGISPQTLYNIRDNRSFPSTPTIKLFERSVPSLSLALLYEDSDSLEWRGADQAPASPVQQQPPAQIDSESLVSDLKQMIGRMQTRIEVLEMLNQTLTTQIVKLSDRDFPASDSHTTPQQHAAMFDTYQHKVIQGFVVPNTPPVISKAEWTAHWSVRNIRIDAPKPIMGRARIMGTA